MERPLLIFDGDCAFCCYWVRYWQSLSGGRIDYRPYQDVGHRFPDISRDEFAASIQLIEPHEGRLSGAAAGFRILWLAGHPLWDRLYRRVPGFAGISEHAYGFIARRRVLAARAVRLLWGEARAPARYHLAAWLFLRCIALTYIAAFVSFGVQITGLVGANGILPVTEYLPAAKQYLGTGAYWQLPTLFWFDAGDTTLVWTCRAGVILATLALIGWFPTAALLGCYVCYLSLFYAGQVFMTFQWDLLLLEAGFLAIFLPARQPVIPWLFRWLLFRFMFLSGAVKLLSQDPAWRSLRALTYHFETQPLPTPLAWYAHHLPEGILHFGAAFTFVVELLLPLFFFAPRRPRLVAAAAVASLELLILLTGNYNFFNLLTIALCVFLIEDRDLGGWMPARLRHYLSVKHQQQRPSPFIKWSVAVIAGIIFLCSIDTFINPLLRRAPQPLTPVSRVLEPLRIANSYGLFAVMTTTRPEIIIEGSMDKQTWLPYTFRYKPGDVDVAPRWNIPHQPRLDWQLWFAALGDEQRNPWFGNLMYRLLFNVPEVTRLFAHNPFPDTSPRYVRAMLYQYRFSTARERENSGAWWVREPEGFYYPPIALPAADRPVRDPGLISE